MKYSRSLTSPQAQSGKKRKVITGRRGSQKGSVGQAVVEAESSGCLQGKASTKPWDASCLSGPALVSRTDLVYHTGEGNAPWASFFFFFPTSSIRFQLLLLYHFLPEGRRLVKDKQCCDNHCNQDQGEENHEEDVGGM